MYIKISDILDEIDFGDKLSEKEKNLFYDFKNSFQLKLDDVIHQADLHIDLELTKKEKELEEERKRDKSYIPFFTAYDYLDRTHDCNLLGEQKRRLKIPRIPRVSEEKIVTVEKLADGAFSRVYIDKETNTVYTIYDADEDISKQIMVDYMNSKGDLMDKLNFPNFTDYGTYMQLDEEEVKGAKKRILEQNPSCTFPYSRLEGDINLRMVSSPYYQEVGKAKGFYDKKINERAEQLIDFLAEAENLAQTKGRMYSQKQFLNFSDIVGLNSSDEDFEDTMVDMFEKYTLVDSVQLEKLSQQLKHFLNWFHNYQKRKYNEQRNIIQLDMFYTYEKIKKDKIIDENGNKIRDIFIRAWDEETQSKYIVGKYWNFALDNTSYDGYSGLIYGRELVFLDPFIIYQPF